MLRVQPVLSSVGSPSRFQALADLLLAKDLAPLIDFCEEQIGGARDEATRETVLSAAERTIATVVAARPR